MQTLEFILSLLLLITVWRFVLRRSLLDQARDRLFDLRDDLRSAYVHNGWPLDATEYKQARDLINAHLHFLESISAWQIFTLQAGMATNAQLRKLVEHRYETMFADVPVERAKIVQLHRRKSLQIVTEHAVTNSLLLITLGFLMFPVVVVERTFSAARRGVVSFLDIGSRSIAGLGSTVANLIERALQRVAKWLIQPQAIEQCAVYRWSH
jgi:hypothetical protein